MAVITQVAEFYLDVYRIESITAYNRLESSPRTADFDRSLKAEVRDALWMLTRQWQFGEFKGEDAATAVSTQIKADHTTMDRVHFPGNVVFPYSAKLPLETTVEREKLNGGLFIAVQTGRYFNKLMKGALLSALDDVVQLLLNRYRIDYSPDENDLDGKQLLIAVKERVFDGFLLYRDIVTEEAGSTVFLNWLSGLGIADEGKLISLSEQFHAWYQRNYSQPNEELPAAWLPSKLEYEFAVSSAPKQEEQKTLVAKQYHEGHVDWYSFDMDRSTNILLRPEEPRNAVKETKRKSYIPSPVTFKGMPNPRFWMMEEKQTDFGKIDTTPTGLLHLLLAEFGLTYSNDWFMLPYELPVNTLCEIENIIVKDVFGQYTLILAAGRAPETQWQRWSMFTHTNITKQASNSNFFYLAPSVTKLQEGDPLEQVNFIRDEMANMVWGIENIVPSQAGKGVSGDEMALDNTPKAPFVPIPGTKVRYILGTTVPDNWIPFIPVQIEGSVSEIQLQRAALPRAKGALGVLLTEKAAPYYINEEMIRRSGIIVKRSFQRARWSNGETCLWLGRMKETGKGEGWSNLKFDQIEDV